MFDGIEIRGTGWVVHAVDLVLVLEVIGDTDPVRSGVDLKNDVVPVVFRQTFSSWVEGPGKATFVSEDNCGPLLSCPCQIVSYPCKTSSAVRMCQDRVDFDRRLLSLQFPSTLFHAISHESYDNEPHYF